MNAFGKFLAAVIAVALVAVIAFISWHFFIIARTVYDGAKELKPEIYVPLAVTILTATLGLTATLYTQYTSRKREVEAAHRERKIEIYLQFLNILEKLLTSNNPDLDGEPIDSKTLAMELIKIRTKSVLWASPGVIKALSQIGSPQEESNSPIRTFRVLDELQREMRKDIGLSNASLGQDFFIKLYLKNEAEYRNLLNYK